LEIVLFDDLLLGAVALVTLLFLAVVVVHFWAETPNPLTLGLIVVHFVVSTVFFVVQVCVDLLTRGVLTDMVLHIFLTFCALAIKDTIVIDSRTMTNVFIIFPLLIFPTHKAFRFRPVFYSGFWAPRFFIRHK
jgi:hypothetical protein